MQYEISSQTGLHIQLTFTVTSFSDLQIGLWLGPLQLTEAHLKNGT